MKRTATVVLIAVSQLVLVGVAVAPQLSARVLGDTYLVRVAPVDPIDPFRGAYVALDYPDLRHDDRQSSGEGWRPLRQPRRGGRRVDRRRVESPRPADGPYLACDDRSWQVRCGIESWFLPQDEAREAERLLQDGAVAEIKVDSRGNAAVVGVRAG